MDIKKLRPLVDILILSIHWGVHFVPALIAMYQKEVGYAAIDAGVDLILGHHPHILKGIEVYKGKVIFYSLCNFVMPSAKGASRSKSILAGRRDFPDYPDYRYPVDSRKSMVAKCLISNKQIDKVSYLPIMINGHAQPEILSCSDKRSTEVFDYIEWCCRDQGLHTRFSREVDEVIVST
ncbi:CapA family protein [Chloroflexota bacterium]